MTRDDALVDEIFRHLDALETPERVTRLHGLTVTLLDRLGYELAHHVSNEKARTAFILSVELRKRIALDPPQD
jgi:energy-converting hydrogenase Eha subunit F